MGASQLIIIVRQLSGFFLIRISVVTVTDLTDVRQRSTNQLTRFFMIGIRVGDKFINSFVKEVPINRNQSIDWQNKSVDWFPYDRDPRHEE